MKANEIPEKLYFGIADKGVLDIYSAKESDDEIEYTRTDAFIEKATLWLEEHLINYYGYNTKAFIEDFKNFMKRE